MKIYNNFGKIAKTDLFLSNEPKKNYYSIVFDKKRKYVFSIQQQPFNARLCAYK